MTTQEVEYVLEATQPQLICLIRAAQEKSNQLGENVRVFQRRIKTNTLFTKACLDKISSEVYEWKLLNELLSELLKFHSNPEEKAESLIVCEQQLFAANEMLKEFKRLYEHIGQRNFN